MICENSEITARGAKPPLPSRQPGPAPGAGPGAGPESGPELKIDLDRLVWDPEYRDQIRRRLKRLG